MSHATRDRQLLHQPQKPAHRARRFDPDHNRRRNRGVKLADDPTLVRQCLLDDLTGIAIQHRNTLLACMQVASDQSHLGLLQSERCEVDAAQSTRSTRGRRRYDINVYAGELEVRPPGAATTNNDPTEKAAAKGIASGLLRRSANQLAWVFRKLQDREDLTSEPLVPKVEYTAMLLGATGNVGGHILHLLVQSPLCKKVVVVTRRNVAELANRKVQQVVVNMDKLEEELAPHAKGVDIALAAFGVGKGSAKMADEDVRKIEIIYPTTFASAAKAGGARVLAMMTAAGADSQSSTKYLRNIGDKEKNSEALKFDFLGLYRPAVILGNSNTPSALGFVMPLFHWAMPSRYHSIHKNDLARAMVAQSEQAFFALAQGKGPAAPAVKILEYKEMELFFVAGDSDAP
jgi:uncharacterized protein YbjT (DUF2867 family)